MYSIDEMFLKLDGFTQDFECLRPENESTNFWQVLLRIALLGLAIDTQLNIGKIGQSWSPKKFLKLMACVY